MWSLSKWSCDVQECLHTELLFPVVSLGFGSGCLLPALRSVWPSFCYSPLPVPWPSHCRRCPESHLSCYLPTLCCPEGTSSTGCCGMGGIQPPQQESNDRVQEGISCPQGLLAIWTSRNVTQSSLVLKWSLCRKTFWMQNLHHFNLFARFLHLFCNEIAKHSPLSWPNSSCIWRTSHPNLHAPVTILEASYQGEISKTIAGYPLALLITGQRSLTICLHSSRQFWFRWALGRSVYAVQRTQLLQTACKPL